MSARTPGEWRLGSACNLGPTDIGADFSTLPDGRVRSGRLIANCLGPQGGAEDVEYPASLANGRLMAAAPELAEALRVLLPMAEAGVASILARSSPEDRPGHRDGLESTLDVARAALAKAGV